MTPSIGPTSANRSVKYRSWISAGRSASRTALTQAPAMDSARCSSAAGSITSPTDQEKPARAATLRRARSGPDGGGATRRPQRAAGGKRRRGHDAPRLDDGELGGAAADIDIEQ